YDAKGLMKTAIRDDNPVIFLENEMLYGFTQNIPTEEYLIPFGVADIKRRGEDCTIVAINRCVHRALDACEQLSAKGIECELVDPRTIKPLDIDTIVESVRRTNRLVIVEECHEFGGCAAEIAMQVQHLAFDDLDAPIGRVTQMECPLPYAANLEAQSIPNPERIVDAVKRVCYR
ncbi:MAG: alpha-ketoacid dehydrogenase subunit beta, partial [Planctomycetota bacterium]